jgi:dTDP-4-dehydrorhamnose reductase
MVILATGAKGMVGSAVQQIFKDDKLIITDKEELDVRYVSEVKKYGKGDIDLVIHLAAETDLEYCQSKPEQAYWTNHTGTRNIKELAYAESIPIVYMSTAGVFDGYKKRYSEFDKPNPLNHYGESKWAGEHALWPYYPVWIFRAGWMMGGGVDIDKKFINKVFKQIKAGAKVIYGLDDVYGSPTYTIDLVRTIKAAITKQIPYGVYHTGGEGECTRYDVAVELVKLLKLKKKVKVETVQGDYFKETFPCPRSKCEILNNKKIKDTGCSFMRPWQEALAEYVKKEFLPLC